MKDNNVKHRMMEQSQSEREDEKGLPKGKGSNNNHVQKK